MAQNTPTKQSPGSGNYPTASDRLPDYTTRVNFGNTQATLQNASKQMVDAASNSGNVKPYDGPTARSLFYQGGFLPPGKDAYGQFLFYSIVGNNDPQFYNNYFLSERTNLNSRVSEVNPISGGARNPSAGFLVRQTQANEGISKQRRNNVFSFLFGPGDEGSYIIGGASAPYYWKDFIYCKYYGHIPNNYMITLRRFPSPMKDNLSLPDKVKNTDMYRVQGAGKPVAQAVTWFGGNTSNSLSTILGITTGLNWDTTLKQSDKVEQQGFASGAFKNKLGDILGGLFGTIGGDSGTTAFSMLQKMTEITAASSDSGFQESVAARRNKALRDRAEQEGGPLSKFIWVSVDTVDRAAVRARGLNGWFETFDLNFHYELASVGEVNSKAAMVDILGNLLALCTNYGQFLTPEIRYDNSFPAVNFPGGDEGLSNFYTDPVKFVKDLISFAVDPNQTTNGNPNQEAVQGTVNAAEKARNYWQGVITQLKSGKLTSQEVLNSPEFNNIVLYAITDSFLKEIVFPASILTGLPTGEWHVVVGNPCNPIAMIGNLICTGVKFNFNDVLGPDDFPTELTATITLQPARERERGEIESIFNRGRGRLYQSSAPVYSNSQSFGAFGTVRGDFVLAPNKDGTTDINTFMGPQILNQQTQPDSGN